MNEVDKRLKVKDVSLPTAPDVFRQFNNIFGESGWQRISKPIRFMTSYSRSRVKEQVLDSERIIQIGHDYASGLKAKQISEKAEKYSFHLAHHNLERAKAVLLWSMNLSLSDIEKEQLKNSLNVKNDYPIFDAAFKLGDKGRIELLINQFGNVDNLMNSDNEFSRLLSDQPHVKYIIRLLCDGYDIQQILKNSSVDHSPEQMRDARHAILNLVQEKPNSKYYLVALGQSLVLGKFWEGVDIKDLLLDSFAVPLLRQFLENKGIFSKPNRNIMKENESYWRHLKLFVRLSSLLDQLEKHDPKAQIMKYITDKDYWMNPEAHNQQISDYIQQHYDHYKMIPLTMRDLIFDPKIVDKFEKQVLKYRIPLTRSYIDQAISAGRRFFVNLSLFHSEHFGPNPSRGPSIKTKGFSKVELLRDLSRSRIKEGKTLIETLQNSLASKN